jgi:two-component system nitrate/nitrite response regulator NarL
MKGKHFNTIIFSTNALLREGLVRILNAADFNIVSSKSTLEEAASHLSLQASDVLLIIDASDDFDAAISQIEPFKLNHPNGKVAVLVGRHQLKYTQMISAFRGGASAYLMNFATPEAFIKSLELIMFGEVIFPLAMLTYLLDHTGNSCRKNDKNNSHGAIEDDNEHGREENGCSEEDDAIKVAPPDGEDNCLPHLSARQTAILHCLIEGDSNKVIARKMEIADATVKVHIKTILRKIRVENRTQAAIWAIRNNSKLLTNYNAIFSKTTKFKTNVSSSSETSASL